jgi:hypothetical protein
MKVGRLYSVLIILSFTEVRTLAGMGLVALVLGGSIKTKLSLNP